ncbi:MAG TPA: pitrilysin family protein [Thermoanaerobaculia bacterium]|nr:pitrilysin family protein [Thermoanaerobaculia bacterium]
MKRVNTAFAVFASLLMLAGNAPAQVNSVNDIKTPPLRKFSMPQPKRIVLPNGMVIFLQEDHELPLISGSATIRGGSRDIPAAKAGMLGIYSGSWRTGGTTSKTGDELDQFLESRAARVETGGGVDSTSVSMSVLKGDFDTVFPIWVDVLRNPAFREEKITLAKTGANTGISRRNDEPGGILGRELGKLGYGTDSPYSRQSEYATIASITRDDLLAFHRQTVHPNNIILAFIGDFDSAKVEKKLRDTFGSWAKGPQVAKPASAFTPAKPGLYLVAKDDVTQANIGIVHAGIERNNPDYAAVQVMNEIFSGGFSGRLMQTLRSQRGLTYGVGGGVGAAWDYPGLFRVQMATKSTTAIESVQALKEEIAKLTTAPVTADEISLAKESILNAFVFTMDTREKALQQQVLLEFYGFPSNYFQQYPSLIEKVTADDVQRVAKKYVHPDQLAILVVGKEADFEKPLSSLGQVTKIDITIPEANAGAPASTSSNAEGMALLNKVRDFVGGQAAIDAVKTVRITGARKIHTPQGEMEAQSVSLLQYPNSLRMEMTLPMGQITQVISPGAAFAITPMGTQDIPSSQRDSALADMKSDMLGVLKNASNPKYVFTAGKMEKIGDVNAQILDINADGSMTRWYVDPASGRLVRTQRTSSGPQGGDVVTDYLTWQKYGSVNMVTSTSSTRNGEPYTSQTATNVEINPAVDEKAFVKP